MKLKTCPHCSENLPLTSFTSTRAKYCRACKQVIRLNQLHEMQKRAIERLKTKKQKTKGIIRISDLKKQVQKLVNAYIKQRDKDLKCISCQKESIEHAGHFIAQGSSGALRFNLDNIHGQCRNCNVWKHGNLLEYRINLVEKIGLENVKYLEEHRRDIHQWTREELESIKTAITEARKAL